jgi:MerR family transcriptional regulator, light-induced transcriptional regulator
MVLFNIQLWMAINLIIFFLTKHYIDILLTKRYINCMNEQKQKYSIQVVTNRTGLSQHVIRVWEKRYEAVVPERTDTNRRMYSDEDILRLQLLNKATKAGHKISQIANLSKEELEKIVNADSVAVNKSENDLPETNLEFETLESILNQCIIAAKDLNSSELEKLLTRSLIYHSIPAVIEQLIAPLLRKIGNLWRDGDFRVSHEHAAAAVIRSVLGNVLNGRDLPQNAPGILVSSPSGQLHELGALLVAVTASNFGWKVTYLGPNLTAEEIAGAAIQSHVKAVALSIIYPANDLSVVQELQKLRKYLPENIKIIVGGRAAFSYRKTLDEINAFLLKDTPSFCAVLDSIELEV